MTKRLVVCAMVFMSMLAMARAAYEGWNHSGSLYILTTPDGANLPATMEEENFPLLVRLNKDWFDFSQAKANGEDIRFASPAGVPLAYQVEEWNASSGTAVIWVSIPVIKGNARQEIKMYWGKADSASESSGPAVFNSTNGYCCVMHLSGDVLDSTGSISPVNDGATPTSGEIGSTAWNLVSGSINATNITNFPKGKNTFSSSEVWLRVRKINNWSMPLAWGTKNCYGWNTWVMQIGFWGSSPVLPSTITCRGPMVSGSAAIGVEEWTHVAYTTSNGTGRLYINGLLDATAAGGTPTLTNLQALCLSSRGGDLDVDEARISSVARSDDWVKMEYENQKRLQTLAGSLVQPGSDFSVSEKKIIVLEGKSATVSAKAGGAQKVYWILKKDGVSTVVAVDKLSFTVEAGRETGDQAFTLQFKAVFADRVGTREIPVIIREDIPDPVFTLSAPLKWDGRETIEIVPKISNLNDLRQKNVGELKYDWKISGMAVIKEIEPGKLILKRSFNSGKLAVTATISNGGKPINQAAVIAVEEPKKDSWVQRIPGKDEKAVDNQFYPRDDRNEGSLYYNGALSNAADVVFLKLYAGDKLIKTETVKPEKSGTEAVGGPGFSPAGGGQVWRYAFAVRLKPGLIKYKVEFGSKTGSAETVLDTVTNLVCGDAYLIDGQSNALALDTGEKSPAETSEWIRSYGGPTGWRDGSDWVSNQVYKVRETTGRNPNLWCNAVWKRQKDEKAELGWWGMELAKRLVASQKVPICIIQAAVGGSRIDQHQRCESNHTALATMYGRMLWRVEQAKLTHGIRGVLWHQGENNQGAAAPTGDYDWKSYQDYFVEMSAAWKQDFPNIQHYYIFQIWPNSCSMAGKSGCGDMIRETQRTLPRLYSNMDVMSTLGIKPPGGCHYPLAGWSEFARLVQPLIERDNYGKAPNVSITAPNLKRAAYTSSKKDAIALEFDQPVVWNDSLVNEFYLDGAMDMVASGNVSGKVITLYLKAPSAAKKITYLKEMSWSQDRLIMGANGIAALTFAEVEIETGR